MGVDKKKKGGGGATTKQEMMSIETNIEVTNPLPNSTKK